MSEKYVLRTDRELQWKSIEERFIKNGNTRKNIKICKDYFFKGVDNSQGFRFIDYFVFYPDPTFSGWQTLFDVKITDKLSDDDFLTLQFYFCGQLYEYFFDAEDQSYYFKTVFGDRYDKNRLFPIRINRESKFRKITLRPNQIFRHLMTYFSRYMKDVDVYYAGLLRFNLDYLDSLLPMVSKDFFAVEANDELTEDNVRIAALQSSISKMLKWSYAKPSEKIDQERIDAANAVKAVFLNHADNLGEFNAVHRKIRSDLGIED
jgi:hypothetical protein